MGPFAVAIAFWAFVAIAAVAGIVADYKKREAALAPLRLAIERGQQLDPALVERLMTQERDAGIDPLYLRVGGIIAFAAGVGVIILSFILAQVTPIALYPVLGGGVVLVCVAVGILVAARAVESHRGRAENAGKS
jgi:hypothetical protein